MLLRESAASGQFVFHAHPNRSLTKRGRALWLCLFGMNALVVAFAAGMIGAWPVIPFAGLEVALIAFAFWWIGRHDDDYETISVRGDRFEWECRTGRNVASLAGNSVWARITVGDKPLHHAVLAYGDQQFAFGQSLSPERRLQLSHELKLAFLANR